MTPAVAPRLRGAADALRQHPSFRAHPVRLLARTAHWTLTCAVRRDAVIELDSGARLTVPPRWLRSGSGAIFVFRDDYEVELRHLGRLVEPGMTFVDGGANIGIFSVAAGQLVGPTGRVLAVEPAHAAAARLRLNAEHARPANIVVERAALSDHAGRAPLFHVNGGPVGYSLGSLDGAHESQEQVTTTTVDDLVARHGLDRVDVIKLDVEGAEELALRGANETLQKHRPTILFEYNVGAPTPDGRDHLGAWHVLRDLDYELFGMTGDGHLEHRAEPLFGNNIARPRR